MWPITDINELDAKTLNACRAFLDGCRRSNILLGGDRTITVIILETRRELVVQMANVMRGRIKALPSDNLSAIGWVQKAYEKAGMWKISAAEAVTPNTATLDSKHIERKAFDAAPSLDGVHPWWDAPQEVWDEMHRIGESVGLRCGIMIGKSIDNPHFETA